MQSGFELSLRFASLGIAIGAVLLGACTLAFPIDRSLLGDAGSATGCPVPNPCQHGGTCTAGADASFTCTCDPLSGYSGPTCETPAECPSLAPPVNGFVDRTMGVVDDVATFSCESFFYLVGNGGSSTRTCQPSGAWTGSDLTCVPTGGYPVWFLPGTTLHPRDYDVRTMTVIDRITGLEWQRVLDSTTFDWPGAADYCASSGYDGRNDWRLPTRIELVSIVDYAHNSITAGEPAIDATAFPNTPLTEFWTSSPDANTGSGQAWMVDFRGPTSLGNTSGPHRVRCVRGSTALAQEIAERFTVNAGDTVTDNVTGLVWRQFPPPVSGAQTNAMSICNSIGGAPWRVPEISELQSIVDESVSDPALDPTAFLAASGRFWSSTFVLGATVSTAYAIDLTAGIIVQAAVTTSNVVLCVH